jgi:predicted histone-like DNA-binding protein
MKYKIYQSTRNDRTKNLWYARPAYVSTINLKELAKHMASHNTLFSPGAIEGVLTDMVGCIRELLLQGNQVRLPELALFSLRVSSQGVENREDFTPSKHIRSIRMRARPCGDMKTVKVSKEVSLSELSTYNGSSTGSGTGTSGDNTNA